MTGEEILVQRTWSSEILDSREDFTLSSVADGYRLAGRTLIPREGDRVEIDYLVETRPDWSIRSAGIKIPAFALDLGVAAEEGVWSIDGFERPDLAGCTDIDFAWTPATNTLPIRRLEPMPGVPISVKAAWLRWPELEFVASDQTYTRQADDRWSYASGDFEAELRVDGEGVVTRYGDPPIWEPEYLRDH